MSKWQPIETAPKDGTQFMAYQADDGRGHSFFAVARMLREEWHAYEPIDGTDTYRREKKSRLVMVPDHHWFKPTHWMPLPAPPEAEER